MRRAVIASYRCASVSVNSRRNGVSDRYGAFDYFTDMQIYAVICLLCVGNFDFKSVAADTASVAYLAAAFTVERRFIKNDYNFTAVLCTGNFVYVRVDKRENF